MNKKLIFIIIIITSSISISSINVLGAEEECTLEGETKCEGLNYQTCIDGFWYDSEVCSGSTECKSATCNQINGCGIINKNFGTDCENNGYCLNGVCQTCKEYGTTCNIANECCSGRCFKGKCAEAISRYPCSQPYTGGTIYNQLYNEPCIATNDGAEYCKTGTQCKVYENVDDIKLCYLCVGKEPSCISEGNTCASTTDCCATDLAGLPMYCTAENRCCAKGASYKYGLCVPNDQCKQDCPYTPLQSPWWNTPDCWIPRTSTNPAKACCNVGKKYEIDNFYDFLPVKVY